MKNPNIKVGQTVWLRAVSYSYSKVLLKEDIIDKIGAKYVTTRHNRLKFHIDTLKQDNGDYSPRYILYLDPQVYYDEIEMSGKCSAIRDAIGKVTEIEKIREIYRILFENEETQK
jgi:hypothetical protein